MLRSVPMDMFAHPLLLVALGGALGGVGRFWLSGLVARGFGESFPWGTLVVNVSGCAAIGALAAIVLDPASHADFRLPLWLVLAVGILGSYTTVSSFALQTLALARGGERWSALANVALSVTLCLAAATLGYGAASELTGG
jgi:fluoride exporter